MDAARTVLIVAGGAPVEPVGDAARARHVPEAALVIAADGGLHNALRLGLTVDVLVGDLDSVGADDVAAAEAAGTRVEAHPRDKDATDLELAMDTAVAWGAERIVVVGGGGGRLDHLLGNALLLGSDRFAGIALTWWVDGYEIHAVRAAVRLAGEPGDLVTLLPLGGPAGGVTTTGLRWSLATEDLDPATTRGLSNELVEPEATVAVAEGVLLVMHRRRR